MAYGDVGEWSSAETKQIKNFSVVCIRSHRKKGEREYGDSKAKREDGFTSISVLDVKRDCFSA